MELQRKGHVIYLAGKIGASPLYQRARVEDYGECVLYYPPGAITTTTDGGATLPPELLPAVIWNLETNLCHFRKDRNGM